MCKDIQLSLQIGQEERGRRRERERERDRERDPRLSPRLHCYPTDDPAGGLKSVWLGLSCTEVSSLLVCAGIMG